MKILVADDKKENRYLLESALKTRGYEIITAANGHEALDILKNSHVDLIITDILMPKMDGFQLCREIKADEKLKKIPFIFYTAAYTSPEDQKFGLDIGADGYIIKPIEPDEFLRIIDGILLDADKIVPVEPLIKKEPQNQYLQGYSSRIFSQLEKKIEELEEKNLELIESQKALKESENKFHTLYNSIMEAVFFYEIKPDNSPGKILEANEAACKKSGYSYEEILQMNIADFYSVPEKMKPSETDAANIKSRFSFETEIKRKDGRSFPVYVKAGIIGMQGKNYGISLVRDLTAEKESRMREMEALRDIEQNLTLNATLNDQIRNPLAVISGLLCIEDTEKSKAILEQVKIIDDIITRLDRGWLESAKIREFLIKHLEFGSYGEEYLI